LAAHVEHVGDEASGGAIGVSRREGELDAIVRQDGVDLVGDRGDHLFQKGRRRGSSGLADQLNDSEFARAINGDIEVELAFGGLDLGDVYVHLADWVGLESLLGGLVAFDIGAASICRGGPGSDAATTASDVGS